MSKKPCCDLHNQHCEPPSDLCCWQCTEADHPPSIPCTWQDPRFVRSDGPDPAQLVNR